MVTAYRLSRMVGRLLQTLNTGQLRIHHPAQAWLFLCLPPYTLIVLWETWTWAAAIGRDEEVGDGKEERQPAWAQVGQ